MARETPLVYGVKEVFVIVGEKAVGVDDQLLLGGEHLHLSLLPIGLGNREFLGLVGLDLVNDVILAVKIDAEADAVFANTPYPNLSVPALYAKRVKDAMLIGGTRRRVLVAEIVLGEAELNAPPLGEGVGLPIAHDRGRITCSQPTGT